MEARFRNDETHFIRKRNKLSTARGVRRDRPAGNCIELEPGSEPVNVNDNNSSFLFFGEREQ